MVLQLCGRVCRRLSLKNPHHSFDEDFLFLQKFGANLCVGRLSLKNPHHSFDEDFFVTIL
jgi:hypothetical protein